MPVPTQVEGDGEQPGRELPIALEAISGPHHAHPGLLAQVLDVLPTGVAGHEGVQRAIPAAQQPLERGLVARRQPDHQVLVGRHSTRVIMRHH
jgi:hypothetical protein